MAPRNVGTITAVLRILTAGAYRDTERAASNAGEKAADSFGNAFEKRAEREKFDRLYRRWQRNQRGPVERMGERLGGLFSIAWGRGLTRQGRLWYRAIVGLLEPATALVLGLGGAATALAGSLGSASLSVGTLVPLVGALGLGAAALLVGFTGITGELEDMNAPLREVVESVKALEPAWQALTEAVQVELWEGVGDAITRVADTVLPQLQEGLVGAAAVLNENLLDALERIEGFDWADLFGDLTPILDSLLGSLVEFGEAFFFFMDAAAPAAQRVADALEGVAARWNEWIQSNPDEINRILQEALDRTSAWKDALSPLGSALQNIFAQGADAADSQLVSMEGLFTRFDEWTESVAGKNQIAEFFDRSFAALEAFSPAISGLATGLNRIFTDQAISNLEAFSVGLGDALVVVGDLFAAFGNAGLLTVFGDMLGYVADVVEPLIPFIETVATLIGDLLAEALDTVGPLLADLAEVLGPALAEIFEALAAEVLPTMVSIFEDFGPVLGELIELFAELAPVIADLIVWLAPLVGWVLQLAATLLGFVAGVGAGLIDWLTRLPEHFQTVGDWFSQLGEWIGNVVESIGSFFESVGEFFAGVWESVTEFFTGIGESISEFFTGIYETFTGWVDSVMELWERFTSDPLTFIEDMIARIEEILLTGMDRAEQIIGDAITAVIEFFLTLPGDVAQAVRDMRERVKEWFERTKEDAVKAIERLWQGVKDWFTRTKDSAVQAASDLLSRVVSFFTQLPQKVIDRARAMWQGVKDWFQRAKDSAVQTATSLVSDVVSFFAGLPGRIGSALGNLASTITSKFDIVSRIGGIISSIVGLFSGLGSRIISAIGNIGSRILSTIKGSIPGPLQRFLPFAEGGIVFGPTRALIGEAGPEAVIPLSRPLSQIDPSVREMAAMLRGESTVSNAPVAAGGKVVHIHMNVYPQSNDPAAIAAQVVNRAAVLTASA